jgi:2-keto-4-pentenoate hydratase/2-oxohepta-3-ene-1,7-dioic acid hydratase in catechol pathway
MDNAETGKMRLVTFDKNGQPAPGILQDDRVVDLGGLAPDMPRDWPTLFGDDNLERLRAMAETAPREASLPREALTLLPPIPASPKILCVGLNYRAHAAETGAKIPLTPIFFVRFPSSMVGDGQPIVRPSASEQFDYEGEMVAVIGRAAHHVPPERALDHVVGYGIFNDGSLRDYQKAGKQWTLGKNADASGAFGPAIVTADEVPAGASGLRVETRVDGEVLQEGRTDDMIFDVAHLVSKASEVMTLEPGTILVTGTPPGVGMAREPQRWLKPGETVAISIEGLGTLTNTVVDEGPTGT